MPDGVNAKVMCSGMLVQDTVVDSWHADLFMLRTLFIC